MCQAFALVRWLCCDFDFPLHSFFFAFAFCVFFKRFDRSVRSVNFQCNWFELISIDDFGRNLYMQKSLSDDKSTQFFNISSSPSSLMVDSFFYPMDFRANDAGTHMRACAHNFLCGTEEKKIDFKNVNTVRRWRYERTDSKRFRSEWRTRVRKEMKKL